MSKETAILCKYHLNDSESDKYRHHIGIGVARKGPETYNPGKFEVLPNPAAKTHTTVAYDHAL